MRPELPQNENPSPPERASVRANASKIKRARAISEAVGIDLTPDEAAEIRRDAEAHRRKPKARQEVRRAAALGPVGRARRRLHGEKPARGKQGTAAKTKSQRAAASRKLHAHKKLKATRGSPKAIRRIRNRKRAR